MMAERLQRYVPLLVWALVALAVLLVPLKIISQGYLPGDDGLRYAAKAVSGKSWPEILVMRPGITLDHNPGWNALLAAVHRWTGAEPDALVSCSVVALFCLFGLAALPWLRRPEAWLGTLLIMTVFAPAFLLRMSFGRPFILSMAALVALLLLWSRSAVRSPAVLAGSTLLIATAVWVHGAWYLFALPVAAFWLAGRWRDGALLAACTGAGSLLGALPTGHPVQYLLQALDILYGCLSEQVLQRMLVAEFCPFDGDFRMVLVVVLVWVVMKLRGGLDDQFLRQPAFMLVLLGWVLGFRAHRCWLDWGLPALWVWLALQLQPWFEAKALHLPRRAGLALALALGFYASATSDLGGRWTDNLSIEYLTPDNPDLAGWLPENDGIIYNSDMRIFYQTFFKNPRAPWRYVLGFEPTLMRPEDLKVLRQIQWNYGDARAYEPWVKKMRPADRLILRGPATQRPSIAGLEWHYGATDTWIGRLPHSPGFPR